MSSRTMHVERFEQNPIVYPGMPASSSSANTSDLSLLQSAALSNINGPSLIRVPDWVKNPLGRYYLYFAHHDGRYIRLAYSEFVQGPYMLHQGGVLPLDQSLFAGHIASPDVIVDDEAKQIRLYYHGAEHPSSLDVEQSSRVAVSSDGLTFKAFPECLGEAYFRIFRWKESYYALAMPGIFYRSDDGLTNFVQGPTMFTPQMRHSALHVKGSQLYVYFTNAGDCPERILCSTIELSSDWMGWSASTPTVVLEPEMAYEGADQPLEPSDRGLVIGPVRQLRDPAIYEEGADLYLLYAVAGESGIAIAKITNPL